MREVDNFQIGNKLIDSTRQMSQDFLRDISFGLTLLGVLGIVGNGIRLSEGLTVSDLCFAIAACILLLSIAFRGAVTVPPGWLLSAVTLIAMSGGIALASSLAVQEDIASTFRFLASLFMLPLVIAYSCDGQIARIRLLAYVWLISGTLSAGVAFLDFTEISSIGAYLAGQKYTLRESGLNMHPNHLALSTAMLLPIAQYFYRSTTGFRQLASGSCLIVLVLGVLLSGSRAGIMGLAVCVGYWIYKYRKRIISPKTLAVGGILGTLFTIFLLTARPWTNVSYEATGSALLVYGVVRMFDVELTSEGDAERIQKYETVAERLQKSPVAGGGAVYYRVAHNIYLQLLEGGGLLAFLGFSIFAVGNFLAGISLVRRSKKLDGMVGALLLSLSVWLIVGLAQNPIYDRFLYMPTALIVALYFWSRRSREDSSSEVADVTEIYSISELGRGGRQ